MGLSLVWEITNLHGGCVRVEESSDKGTTIAVELPTGTETEPPVRIYHNDPWLFHGDCFRPTTLSQQFSISALSRMITGMALSCCASYGL